MDVAELASKLPWILGAIAVVWLLRRMTRPRALHELPVHSIPPAPTAPPAMTVEPAQLEEVEASEAEADEASDQEIEQELEDDDTLEEDAAAEEAAEEAAADDPTPIPPSSGIGGIVTGIVVVAGAAAGMFAAGGALEGDPRHIAYLVGMIVLLVGSGFLRNGLQRFVIARRRRAREVVAAATWLRDRDWRQDGAEPIAEEALLPQFLSFVFIGGLLLPFHTIWAVDWSWWGFWVVIGILDLLLFAVVVVALRSVWFRIVGGSARVRWNSVPVAPGGTFRAVVEVARLAPTDAPARVTLRCMRDGSRGGSPSEDPAPDAEKVWAEEKTFPVRPLPGGGAAIEVAFAIPPEARGTDTRRALPIRWQLVVSVPTAGPDFETIFPAPIYAR